MIKKYILVLFISTLIGILPTMSHAQTYTISELQELIAKLQAQLKSMQTTQGASICALSKDLSVGDGDGDGLSGQVTVLQKKLISDGYLNVPKPTGWFGKMTESAVKQWQQSNKLVPSGHVGQNERDVFCGNKKTITQVNTPTLKSASYVLGKDSGSVTGSGLQNAKVYFNGTLVSKEDYTFWTNEKISFVLPTYQAGTYPIYVESSNGRSNTVNLDVK